VLTKIFVFENKQKQIKNTLTLSTKLWSLMRVRLATAFALMKYLSGYSRSRTKNKSDREKFDLRT